MARGEMIKMTMSDGAQIGVYRVEPKGARRGGLVLIQEIFGVTQHIKSVSDGYADEGYEVLAPSLFDREEPGFEADYSDKGIQRGIKLARQEHPFDLSVADCCTLVAALKEKGPVFITGYCYGGSVVWAAACKCDGLAAASSFYGSQFRRHGGETAEMPDHLPFRRARSRHSAGRREEDPGRPSGREGVRVRRRSRLQFRPGRPPQRTSCPTREAAHAGPLPHERGVIFLFCHRRLSCGRPNFLIFLGGKALRFEKNFFVDILANGPLEAGSGHFRQRFARAKFDKGGACELAALRLFVERGKNAGTIESSPSPAFRFRAQGEQLPTLRRRPARASPQDRGARFPTDAAAEPCHSPPPQPRPSRVRHRPHERDASSIVLPMAVQPGRSGKTTP